MVSHLPYPGNLAVKQAISHLQLLNLYPETPTSRSVQFYSSQSKSMKTMVCLLDRSYHFPLSHLFPGRHTVLDHYTFKWTEGRMALALGLGHS